MVVGVILFTIVVIGAWLAMNYQRLKMSQAAVQGAWAKVDAQLKQRLEMIPRLVDAYGSHMKQKPDVLEELTKAHSAVAALSSASIEERAGLEDQLGAAMGQCLQGLEQDPEVLNSDAYVKLRDEILGIEDQLVVLRALYNDSVVRFNMQRQVFPCTLLAQKLGMVPAVGFTIQDAFERYPLKVKATLPTRKRSFLMEEGSQSTAE